MKFRRTFPPLLILFLLTIASTQPSSSAVATEQGASASGEGEFLLFTNFGNELVHFSFDVQANKHGKARGRAEFDNLADDTQVVAKIDCLRVSGSEALMTGTVLHSNDPDFPRHENVIFGATDQQLAPIFGFDTITPLFLSSAFFGAFTDCHDASSLLTILQVTGGGIEINPGPDK